MAVKRMWFKTSKVWVTVDEAGLPVVNNGRAEIRYKETDERTYSASPANIRPLKQSPAEAARTAKSGIARPAKQVHAAKPSQPSKPIKGEIQAWTDGACTGNPGLAGAGVVLIFGKAKLSASRFLGKATNNIAELTAIKVALELIKDKRKTVRIFTDSTYSLGVLSKGWKAKKNVELVEEIRGLLAQFSSVTFEKVKGHAGIEENELADELARRAIETQSDETERDAGEAT